MEQAPMEALCKLAVVVDSIHHDLWAAYYRGGHLQWGLRHFGDVQRRLAALIATLPQEAVPLRCRECHERMPDLELCPTCGEDQRMYCEVEGCKEKQVDGDVFCQTHRSDPPEDEADVLREQNRIYNADIAASLRRQQP